MTYAALLLDKAKNRVSPANFSTLGERLGVSRQVVSAWRNGHEPIPEERVAQIAKLAGEDAGTWLVALHAERAEGDARKGWLQAARQLGFAAAVVVGFALPGHARASQAPGLNGFTGSALCEVLRNVLRAILRPRRQHQPGYGSAAVLA